MAPTRKLPNQRTISWDQKTVILLFVCRVPEAFIYNMLFTYINQLATWLQLSSLQTGAILAAFTAGECMSASIWGHFSDMYGRRFTILLGLVGTAVCSLSLGIADRFWKCVVSRLLAGLLNGNLGILQTLNMERCDASWPSGEAIGNWHECSKMYYANAQYGQVAIQLGWLAGSLIGAVAGGFLANAPEIVPWLPRTFPILDASPLLLPGFGGCVLVTTCFAMAFLYLPETLEDEKSLWNDFCRWLKYHFDREASPSDYQCTQTTFADGSCVRSFVDDPYPTKRDYIRRTLIVFLQAGHLAGSDKLMPDLLADHGWAPGHIGDLLGLAVFVQVVALLIAHFCRGLTRETYYCVTAMYPSLYICISLANLLPTHMWVCAATTLNILRALVQSVVIPSLSQIVADLAIDSPWRGRTTGRLNATAYAARLVALLTYGPLQDFGRGLGFAYLPWCFNAIVASVNACVLLSSSAFFNAKSHRFK